MKNFFGKILANMKNNMRLITFCVSFSRAMKEFLKQKWTPEKIAAMALVAGFGPFVFSCQIEENENPTPESTPDPTSKPTSDPTAEPTLKPTPVPEINFTLNVEWNGIPYIVTFNDLRPIEEIVLQLDSDEWGYEGGVVGRFDYMLEYWDITIPEGYPQDALFIAALSRGLVVKADNGTPAHSVVDCQTMRLNPVDVMKMRF